MEIKTSAIYHNPEAGTWFYLDVWFADEPAYEALNLRYTFKKPKQLSDPAEYTCMSNFASISARTVSMLNRLGISTAKIVKDSSGKIYKFAQCNTADQDTPQV